VEKGQPLATLYATHAGLLAEPAALLRQSIAIAAAPPKPVQLVSRVFDRESAEAYLQKCSKVIGYGTALRFQLPEINPNAHRRSLIT